MTNVNAFDKNVQQYEEWFIEHPYAYVSELRAVRELLPPGCGFELGIGTGRFAAPLGIKLGVEPSRAMAEQARKKGLDVIPGVAESLPFRDQEFDFALMVTTVCFLDDIDLAFCEAYRVLKPSGSFLIGFVDKNSPIGKSYEEKKNQSLFYKNAVFYSPDELVARLTKAGFRAFGFRQTLFHSLSEIREAENVRDGYGQGSFVVIRAEK